MNNDSERTLVPAVYTVLRRRWQPGDEITLHLDLTPRWTYPDRRVDAVRGCAAIERGPLVYCFEQADQIDGVRLEDLAVRPGRTLGERPVTLAGVGQTIEVIADAVRLRPVPPPGAAPSPEAVPTPDATSAPQTASTPQAALASEVTAVAIPYFQWDNRDGGPMRVWMPQCLPERASGEPPRGRSAPDAVEVLQR